MGKVVESVDLAEDKGAVRFNILGGAPLVYLADGDCCSHSWVESIDDVGALEGATVTGVEDLALRPDSDEGGDVVRYYGVKITTTKGRATLEYRNSSNGYYGGSLVLQGSDYFYGGVFGQNASKEVWRRCRS